MEGDGWEICWEPTHQTKEGRYECDPASGDWVPQVEAARAGNEGKPEEALLNDSADAHGQCLMERGRRSKDMCVFFLSSRSRRWHAPGQRTVVLCSTSRIRILSLRCRDRSLIRYCALLTLYPEQPWHRANS